MLLDLDLDFSCWIKHYMVRAQAENLDQKHSTDVLCKAANYQRTDNLVHRISFAVVNRFELGLKPYHIVKNVHTMVFILDGY